MPSMSLLTGNPGVMISLALLIIGGLVSTLLTIVMVRQGLSVRPILWFALIFGLVVLPQFAYHLHASVQKVSSPQGDVNQDAWWTSLTSAPGTPETTARYFGVDAADVIISDVERMFEPMSVKPRWARFAILDDGRTTIIAAFNEDTEAEAAVLGYLAISGLAGMAAGNTETGFTATRVNGEEIFVHRAGRHLGVWTGPDQQALNRNVLSSTFYHASRGMSAEQARVAAGGPPLGLTWPTAIALLASYTLFVAVVFVKGAAWASAVPARTPIAVDGSVLRSRLLQLNSADLPMTIESGRSPEEIVVSWRHGDRRWIDHTRLHASTRVHKLVLRQDQDSHSVFVSEYSSRYDGSVGAGEASLVWTFMTGITFFQLERQTVFGVVLDEQLRPTGDLSHTWSFDKQEMTAPLIDIVTGSGWGWRPVLWDAPIALRWFSA